MNRAVTSAAAIALCIVLPAAARCASPAACKNPDWRHKPTDRDILAIWPRAAYLKGQNGKAQVTCRVSVQGTLHDCSIDRENPPNLGFGQAAIALTPQFTMLPKICGGHAVQDSVTIPVAFSGLEGIQFGGGDRVISQVPWLEAPTYAQVVAAYPKAGRREKAVGHVALGCAFGGGGRFTYCDVISEVPANRGFGDAAKALAKRFLAPPNDAANRPLQSKTTTIALTFDPQMLSGRTPIIGTPQWTHVPESVDMAASFPKMAAAAHVPVGHVSLGCGVGPGGHLTNCLVTQQSPEGFGFDAAALALSARFQVSVWTSEGLPTVGGHITVPIRYEPPADGAAAKP